VGRGSFVPGYAPPAYCHNCGSPFPWLERKLLAAQNLAATLEDLSAEDRETLDRTLPDLVKDTPATQVAAVRFKRIMTKIGKGGVGMFRELLVDVLSEAAKKVLWPLP
jgi:hypothetical protein